MLHITQVGTVGIFHHIGGAVIDGDRENGLACSHSHVHRHSDFELAAIFRNDPLPVKAIAAPIGADFDIADSLLFAQDVVLAALWQGYE